MTIAEMIAKIEDAEVTVTIFRGQSWRKNWDITLEKGSEDGSVALKANATGDIFGDVLQEAVTKFFGAAKHGVDFVTALPPPENEYVKDDEIPF